MSEMIQSLKEEATVAGYVVAAEVLLDGAVEALCSIPLPAVPVALRRSPEARALLAAGLGGLILTAPSVVQSLAPGHVTPVHLARLGEALRLVAMTSASMRALRRLFQPLLQKVFAQALPSALFSEGVRIPPVVNDVVAEESEVSR